MGSKGLLQNRIKRGLNLVAAVAVSMLAFGAEAAQAEKAKRPVPGVKPAATSATTAPSPGTKSASFATKATVANRTALLSAPPVVRADTIVVYKSQRVMHVMRDGEVLKSYRVALGKDPVGHKEIQGDNKTPEGTYFVDYMKPRSDFHRGIGLSYPSSWDQLQASIKGVPPGGAIMIHGLPNGYTAAAVGHPYVDWTAGCIAVTNREVEEIWSMVREGIEVKILP
jgi:murein L,D-transpeptidase YafK